MERAQTESIEGAVGEAPGRILHSLLIVPLFLFSIDLMIGALAYSAAWLFRIWVTIPLTQNLLPQERWDVVSHPWIALCVSQAFFLYILGLYDDLRVTRYRELLTYIFMACAAQVVTIASIFYLTNTIFPRSVILLFGLINFIGLFFWRAYVKAQLQARTQRVLVVAEDSASASELLKEIERNPWMGLRVVGLMIGNEGETHDRNISAPILGTLQETEKVVEQHHIDEIIFASRDTWKDQVFNALSHLQMEKPLRLAILPSVYEIAIGRLRHINVHDTPLIEVKRHPNEPFERFLKRGFDLGLSLLMLTLLLPFFPLIGLLIKLDSKGTVFYRQERVGSGGRIFELIKFRTMVDGAEDESGETYATENDPRVTRIGRLLRRFRIDEFPQLLNVVKGDMSFVGPRPERPGFARTFSRTLPGYNERHKVKPGITGLAQVRGYYDTTAENKLKYDLAYIYNYSFSLDLLILLETIKVILIRRGS